MTTGDYFDKRPPPLIERLARIEGQSNFLSLLAGIEAGPDTTQDAAALGWIRDRCIPESLEAYWGRSVLYRYGLCQVVWEALSDVGEVKDKDRIWTKGAILDAFDLWTTGYAVPARQRARQFRVRAEDFRATRRMAEGIFQALEGGARGPWCRAMRN